MPVSYVIYGSVTLLVLTMLAYIFSRKRKS